MSAAEPDVGGGTRTAEPPDEAEAAAAMERLLHTEVLDPWRAAHPDHRARTRTRGPRALGIELDTPDGSIVLDVVPRDGGDGGTPDAQADEASLVVRITRGEGRWEAAALVAKVALAARRGLKFPDPRRVVDPWVRPPAPEPGDGDGPPEARGAYGAARRVELFISAGCNLSCYFCCESERIRHPSFMPWADIEARLAAHARAGTRVVQFMGGEATLHPRFVDAAARARSLGMGTLVITNGLRWADRGFAEAIAPWLDQVMISVHAEGEEAGEAVTGRAGWATTFRAAESHLRATFRGRVRCSTVLTRHSAPELEAISDRVLGLGAERWILGPAVPIAGSRRPSLEGNLSLTELRGQVPRLRDLSRRHAARGCRLVFFCIPHCLLGEDLWDDSHDLWVGDQDLSALADARTEAVRFWSRDDDLPGTRPVVLGRRRGAACHECARQEVCGGYFTDYLDTRGEGELLPVPRG